MSPALRRAAAFLYLTGERPRHIQLATVAALRDLAPYTADVRRVAGVSIGGYVLTPEARLEASRDPLAVAGDAIKACGGRVRTEGVWRLTSHYVPFVGEMWEGLAHRGGGGSFRFELGRRSAPFNRGASFTHATAAAYLAAPATWPAWRGLAVELCAARYRDESSPYSEAEAMTWHAAGRSPVDYAGHAFREQAK